jgi:hypothetical protein
MEKDKEERKTKIRGWKKNSNDQQEWNPKVKRNSFNFFKKSEEMYYNLGNYLLATAMTAF